MTDRRTLIAAMAAGAVLPATARAQAADDAAAGPPTRDQQLDAAFAATQPPALIGAVMNKDGIQWSGVRGVRKAGGAEAATLEDRWHLGSNTKAMTAALYGRLVEKGQAKWGATAAELFPDTLTDPAWRETPVERFLNHTSGLKDAAVIGMDWLMTARADPRPLPEQRAALAVRALADAPTGTPGTFEYANANYILIGAVIERITGGSWEDAMREEVFAPLGITTGGFGAPTGDQPWLHREGGGQSMPVDPADPGSDNPLALGPAGTAHMSVGDYGRFVRVFLGETNGWLTPETIAHLTAPPETAPRSYALGWIVLNGQPWASGPVIVHEGSNTMAHAMVVADPAGGVAYVAMSNDETRGGPACQALVMRLIRLG